ncbi:hypothetical protein ACM26V_20535 [Salipaludibacillus sp. HK11]|uniref:hypothetical protein n=1 Tax=Salipaludibacillus sp. HK11 TaxID=3394320 RepID=UPI0039FBDD39
MFCHPISGAASALLNVNPGTRVVIQYNGGGKQGLLVGKFQGFDRDCNANFTHARLGVAPGPSVNLPGKTRVSPRSINSVSF